jgi:hypothetical protein
MAKRKPPGASPPGGTPRDTCPLADFDGPKATPDVWAYDGAEMLRACGLQPDPWQVGFLNATYRRALLCCSRRSGKSTVAAVKALHHAMFRPADTPATVLIFAPAGRQADELLHVLQTLYKRLGRPVPRETDRVSQLDFANGSRIIPLPNNEEAIRGYTPTLILIDEAARVPDELFKAINPMLALGNAQLIVLSTPFGKRGFFYKEWIGEGKWERIKVTADDCPRIDRDFLADEKRALGDVWYSQEYLCSFQQAEGIVYPEWPDCLVDPVPIESLGECRGFAGCDFGFFNPSAVVFSLLDRDDVLWLVEEIYGRRMTDDDLLRKVVPRCDHYQVEAVYCDSEAAGSIEKFRRADLPARKAFKKIDLGIRAVAARLRTGRLKCFRSLKNTIEEARLYRFPDEHERKVPTDTPVAEWNHCLDGIRYMICGIDRVREIPGLRPERRDDEPGDAGAGPARMPPGKPPGGAGAPPPEEDEWRPSWQERLNEMGGWDRW